MAQMGHARIVTQMANEETDGTVTQVRLAFLGVQYIRKTCSDLIYLGYFFCLILLKVFSG